MTRAKGVHGGKPLFCGGCKEFQYEDICGYGFCSRDDRERHCFDLCMFKTSRNIAKSRNFEVSCMRGKGSA